MPAAQSNSCVTVAGEDFACVSDSGMELSVASFLLPGELSGMRAAADKICACIADLRKGKFVDVLPWNAVAAIVGKDRGRIDTNIPEDDPDASKVSCACCR
jgi:hypothetical protein